MARVQHSYYWLQRWLEDDTVLALRLLALTYDEYPEMTELGAYLDRVEILIAVFTARLEGAAVLELDGEYLCQPLPTL